jgi:hypothetical protein
MANFDAVLAPVGQAKAARLNGLNLLPEFFF